MLVELVSKGQVGERRRKIVDWLVEFSTEDDVGDEGGQTLDVTGVEF